MIELEGKNIIITGGSRGIGRATCKMLAGVGARVLFGYHRDHESAKSLVAEITDAGGTAIAQAGDVRLAETASAMFDTCVAEWGSCDVVVGNAGIWKKVSVEDMTPAQWREMMEINLDSCYHLCHFAAKVMKPQRSGKIILISSSAGQRGEAYHAHYAATKAGVIALAKSLAGELGPNQINVNCVCPGWVETDMTDQILSGPEFRETVRQRVPLRRIATPEDVAGVIAFLASDLARHIQGEAINVNGGSVLCG